MEIRPQSTQSVPPSGPTPSERPTLLVFTLGAHRESRRRQLLPQAQKAIEDSLHQTCLDSALTAGRTAGLRLEVCSPLELTLPADVARRKQDGPDFGSRLETALRQTFAEQGGPVVLVGSDVPDLDADHLRRTLEALEEDPECVVVGPSPDGGFYLLATAQPLGAALSAVQWRCRRTLDSLKQALRRQGRRIVLLPTLTDLDRRADLEHWLASSGRLDLWRADLWRGLISRLAEILAGLRSIRKPDALSGSPHVGLRTYRLRGPPPQAIPA